jgi:hypothetical protein
MASSEALAVALRRTRHTGDLCGTTPKAGRWTIATDTDCYELFWDDDHRLIAASINSGTIRWHYHYPGTTLLGATREIGGKVKRFWAATDERGLIYRLRRSCLVFRGPS